MAFRFFPQLRLPALRSAPGILMAGLLLVLVGFLGWLGGSTLWVRWDRGEAEKALAEYDFAEARRRLARCIKIHPRDPELRLLAAQTARRDGDPDAAEQQLDAYHALLGEVTQKEALERVLAKVQRGDMREVLNALMDSLELHHPESEHILEALAMGSVQSYELHHAQFWTNELLTKWPKNAIGRLLYAQTLNTQGNRDKAISLLKELVKDSPRYYKGRLFLADTLFKSRAYREAGVEYAALREQRPDELDPLLGLASTYTRMGDDDHARPLLKQLQEKYPDNSDVLLECGRLALDEKRPADAEPLLRRAVELMPNDNEAQRQLGICLGQLDKPEESQEHLERSKQIEADLILLEKTLDEMSKAPNDAGPRRRAGEICLRNGQVAEGLRWLSGVLDMNPNDKPAHQILADFYESQGDTRQAELHRRLAQ
jgi:predicted Zn-dependent protease